MGFEVQIFTLFYLSFLTIILLRYLTTAVITNPKKRKVYLKDLISIIKQENTISYSSSTSSFTSTIASTSSNYYSDPITDFILRLFVSFDFDSCQKTLQDCHNVILNDFFLVATAPEFLECARTLIFETYCRIHQVIDDMKGTTTRLLGLDEVEGEKWIVNLIRNARMDAKIDAESVIMSETSFYD